MKARIRHTSKIVDVVPYGHGWDYKENKPGTDYECFMAKDLDFEDIEEKHPVIIAIGTRELKDITDEELRKIIEISKCYGAKENWSEINISHIERDHYFRVITVDYEQKSLTGKYDIVKHRFFLEYEFLCFSIITEKPFVFLNGTYPICENTQMLLWLIAQGFNILECLSYAKIEVTGDITSRHIGFVKKERVHLGNGWFTGDDQDMDTSETNQYEVPKESCEFIGTFVGRRGLPVRPNGWHSLECLFITDDGRKIKLYAHRYYWYNRNKKYGCIEKGAEDVVYSAWHTDFPIDFATKVVIGSKWKCEIHITENGTVAWERAEPKSTISQLKKYKENLLYGPHDISML